jgi:hypothetical protein
VADDDGVDEGDGSVEEEDIATAHPHCLHVFRLYRVRFLVSPESLATDNHVVPTPTDPLYLEDISIVAEHKYI